MERRHHLALLRLRNDAYDELIRETNLITMRQPMRIVLRNGPWAGVYK